MTTDSARRDLPMVAITFAVLNVAMFVWSLANGADVASPTPQWMLDHGGNYGPQTLAGEPWRLFTSMFLHYGILHIVMNMVGLLDGGRHVERMYGRAGFIALYLVSGLAGSLASALRGEAVSAGASGAIFGIFGAFGAFLLLHRKRLDAAVVGREARGLLVFLAFNVYIGLSAKGIDMLAHAGGLAAGFLCGLALELGTDHGKSTLKRSILVGVIGCGAVIGAAVLVAPPANQIKSEVTFNELATTENTVMRSWRDIAKRVGAGEMTDAAFADAIEKDILPPWRAAAEKYAKEGSGPLHAKMLDYMRLREEGWKLFVQAARKDDAKLATQAAEKHRDADTQIKAINDANTK